MGFSYADDLRGCIHNDTGTAADNFAAIQAWFAGFPEYKANDFWISGESYAGIYVPSLGKRGWVEAAADSCTHWVLRPLTAYNVVQYNQAAPPASQINLKGIMVRQQEGSSSVLLLLLLRHPAGSIPVAGRQWLPRQLRRRLRQRHLRRLPLRRAAARPRVCVLRGRGGWQAGARAHYLPPQSSRTSPSTR